MLPRCPRPWPVCRDGLANASERCAEPALVTAEFDSDNAEVLVTLLGLLAQAAPSGAGGVFADTLDGYLTALRCSPVSAQPLQAMDALFGDDWPAALDAQGATELFMEALGVRWEEIGATLDAETLRSDPERMQLMPLLTDFDAEPLDELSRNGVLWCEGFLRAVRDHEGDWQRFPEGSEEAVELDAMLLAIAAVTLPDGARRDAYIAEAYEPDDTVDQNALLDDALFNVQDLRLFWQQNASQPLAS